jgi:hypothetical protein
MERMVFRTAVTVCTLASLATSVPAWAQNEEGGNFIGSSVDWAEAEAFFEEVEFLLENGATLDEVFGDGGDRSNYVDPYRVDFCGDASCTTQNMVFQSYSFSYGWSGDNRSRHWVTYGTGPLSGVERVRAWAGSGADDYCDAYYTGGYWDIDSEVWVAAEYDYCDVTSGNYWYSIDEDSGIDDYSYGFTPVVIWQYQIDSTYHHTILWYYYIEK